MVCRWGATEGVNVETVLNDTYAVTDQFSVGQNSFATQSHVQFATLTGGFVATWGDGATVRAQIYDNNGHTVGNEITIGTGSTAAVTELSSGGFVVTWTDGDIHARFLAVGTSLGSEFLVNSTTNGVQDQPVITGLAGGGFLVSWDSNSNLTVYDDIRAQVFDSNGVPIGGEIVASDAKQGDKASATITALAGGEFVLGWFDWAAEVQEFIRQFKSRLTCANFRRGRH